MDDRAARPPADVACRGHVGGEGKRELAAGVAALEASGEVCARDAHVFVPADLLDNDSVRVCASCTVSETAATIAQHLAGSSSLDADYS